MITVELCPGCQLPRAEVGHKWQHDCTEELRRELNKVTAQLKVIRDEAMLQHNLMRSHEVYGLRNQAFEEAAVFVEKQNLLHDEFCNLISKGTSCDCHLMELAEGLRGLKAL